MHRRPQELLRKMAEMVTASTPPNGPDGPVARLWEAQTYYERPFADITSMFDTVYVSLYKALRGTGGAVLAADSGTAAEALLWRRRLGGDLYDAWPQALIALHGLDTLLPNMPAYRDHAVVIAAARKYFTRLRFQALGFGR